MFRMTLSQIIVLALFAMLVAVQPVAASTMDTDLYLPAVGTGAGVAPSFWYTTIWAFNPNDRAVDVEFSFLHRNQSNNPSDISSTVTINSGEVVQIDDAVDSLFGFQGFGAIRAIATEPILVTARIYSQERVVSGDGRVIAFGSRIANGSQDATTFEMSFPPFP